MKCGCKVRYGRGPIVHGEIVYCAMHAAAEETAKERDRLRAALEEAMEWVSNWSPNFVEDDEWPATREKVDAALAGSPVATPETGRKPGNLIDAIDRMKPCEGGYVNDALRIAAEAFGGLDDDAASEERTP